MNGSSPAPMPSTFDGVADVGFDGGRAFRADVASLAASADASSEEMPRTTAVSLPARPASVAPAAADHADSS